MKIKDILSIDLTLDIKNVINIEDISQNEIQKEIEDYIVTVGLAKDFEQFIDKFTSNPIETGVWISGFYGSGKSYFAKMIGYLLTDQDINGTSSRERLLHRFTGVENEVFFKNKISKLQRNKNVVVFLDIAKQDTAKGLSYTLFKNFLKTIHLPQDEYGYMLFNEMISTGKSDIYEFTKSRIGKDWKDVKDNMRLYFTACKEIHLKTGLSEKEYDQLLESVRSAINSFAPSDLAREIKSFIQLNKDTNVVFMFDETSEAINQKKINLLDLEGVSESLNTLGGKAWTVAIAQEKLDDVISNTGINKAQLVKVTDRFVEKIHLEATEVDIIIKSRILKKNEIGITKLAEYFKDNSGKIGDHSNLNGYGITNTSSAESFISYYPFYGHQFNLLQNFLFGTKGYASTKIAARGMIITTFDIVRKLVKEEDLFAVVAGWQIAREADTQPDIRLVNRFNAAENVLLNHQINGRKLLETINFLSESEVTKTTLLNISKSYFNHADDVFQKQDSVKQALEKLVEAKILIINDNTYKITSDVEQKILAEMNGFAVQSYLKKNKLVDLYKKSNLITALSSVTDGVKYSFNVSTDDQDDIANANTKELAIQVKSLYTIGEDRFAEINQLKSQYDENKNLAILFPDNSNFKIIDNLIDSILRIRELENKYPNKSTEEGKVVQDLMRSKEDKENALRNQIDKALTESTLIYLFNTTILNDSNYTSEVEKLQKKMVESVYNKRLQHQVSEALAPLIIKEQSADKLHNHFSHKDFKFFDANGNFIGENLSVVEEINHVIRNTYVSGADLETKLNGAPTGYSYGTIVTTLAALLRAGKLSIKTPNSTNPIYAVKDKGALEVFSKTIDFKRASFKANTQSLTANQKKEIVEFFLEHELDNLLVQIENYKVDYNTNDFQLTNAVRDISKIYVQKVEGFVSDVKDFLKYFPNAKAVQDEVRNFTSTVTPENYISRATDFITQKEDFTGNILKINRMEKFIKNNLVKLQTWANYIQELQTDLNKNNALDIGLKEKIEEYDAALKLDITKSFAMIQQLAQEIKDSYHKKYKSVVDQNANEFKKLEEKANQIILDIEALPNSLNAENLSKAKNIQFFAKQRAVNEIDLKDSITNSKSGFSYSEYLTSVSLVNQYNIDLDIYKASIITAVPPITPLPVDPQPNGGRKEPIPNPPVIRTIKTKAPHKNLSVSEYKNWLTTELQKLANAQPEDQIEIDF